MKVICKIPGELGSRAAKKNLTYNKIYDVVSSIERNEGYYFIIDDSGSKNEFVKARFETLRDRNLIELLNETK